MPQDLLETLNNKLSEVIARLERIEQRQIKTTAMVEEVKEEAPAPVVGSFASSDLGEKK